MLQHSISRPVLWITLITILSRCVVFVRRGSRGSVALVNAFPTSALGHESTSFPHQQRRPFHWVFGREDSCPSSQMTTTRTMTIDASTTTESSSSSLVLVDFLRKRKKLGSHENLVIGNQAGDADSIVSAVALGFVEDKTPIVSITQRDLETQRPETSLLLELAGISADDLIYVDHDIVTKSSNEEQSVTLVDHNKLTLDNVAHWKVTEIVDHHADLGDHLETCPPDNGCRIIAYNDDKALVASACTLVWERLERSVVEELYDPSLSVLLLGVILLDSVNMIPQAGKGTPRDAAAIQALVENTNWKHCNEQAVQTLKLAADNYYRPDTTALFEALQNAKFEPAFWKSLSVRDALRLDYKNFEASDTMTIGISTVLQSLDEFITKDEFVQGLSNYMQEVDIPLLGIMLTTTNDEGQLQRQLIVCATMDFTHFDTFVEFLNEHELLHLQEMQRRDIVTEDNLTLKFFEQGNAKASRKQVAPIMLEFFEGI